MKHMTALFTGLGSIGTRHLKNLCAVASQAGVPLCIDALRHTESGKAPRALAAETKALLHAEYTVQDVETLPRYDMVFITNPTSLHFDMLRALRGKAGALFIEKPIFDGTTRALRECLDAGQKAYVAAPMRWCGVMLALKKKLPQLRVYSARAICSSYLPEWRPDVDYRTVYSAHKDMGGGVTIDLIHEWDYLAELFGMPLETYNFKGTYSHLAIDSDDLSIYIAKYPTLLCEVHLDYFGRSYRRTLELFCENGTVTADFGAGTLTLEDGTILSCEEPVNERYLREMTYFLDYAQNGAGDSVNTPATALHVLKLTLGEM
ncbi:MAG: Gfo/Idh/MocA family oxidoreductase [Ruthenibacterium sp.]